jgi:hypothetical protein
MASLLRRMTGKTEEMKKHAKTLTDDEFEEMFDLKKLPDAIRKVGSSLFIYLLLGLFALLTILCENFFFQV